MSILELNVSDYICAVKKMMAFQGSDVNESELSEWFASNQLDLNSGKVVVSHLPALE